MKTTTCKNCGADRAIHHYKTLQCPTHGREETRDGKVQEWMTIIFEAQEELTDEEIESWAFNLYGCETPMYFAFINGMKQARKRITGK